jgi:hypothetical protein
VLLASKPIKRSLRWLKPSALAEEGAQGGHHTRHSVVNKSSFFVHFFFTALVLVAAVVIGAVIFLDRLWAVLALAI